MKRLFFVVKSGLHGLRNSAVLAVSYRLGLRAKEISALRVVDVVDAQGNLRDECSLSAAATKGGRPRIAYLSNPMVRWALKAYLDGRRKTQGLQFDIRAPLFASQKGGAFTPNTMQQLLHRLHVTAGVVGGTSHSGRRWFATELISKGIDIKAVSVLMGHSSVSMTAHYAEDNPQRLRKIAASLGS